jgi:hypothetical protein
MQQCGALDRLFLDVGLGLFCALWAGAVCMHGTRALDTCVVTGALKMHNMPSSHVIPS